MEIKMLSVAFFIVKQLDIDISWGFERIWVSDIYLCWKAFCNPGSNFFLFVPEKPMRFSKPHRFQHKNSPPDWVGRAEGLSML